MATIDAQTAGSLDAVVMLDTLAWSEGCSVEGGNPLTKDDGYDIIVQGVGDPHGGEVFTDYSHHPFDSGRPAKLIIAPGTRFPNGLRSTASGRYQIILSTWKAIKAALELTDFTPESQDKAALYLMKQRGSIAHLNAGTIDGAIQAHYTPADLDAAIGEDANIWASLPGNNFGQGGHTLSAVVEEFERLLAREAPAAE